jgi:hypothetical protein
MPSSIYAVVLCEGLQDWVFCRRVLTTLGIAGRDVYPVISPAGKGSGEQFVRENYAKEVAAIRARLARRRAALLVQTDADVLTVAARAKTLANALLAAEVPARGPQEPVAILIPKRNVETWIHFYLSGLPVDEQTVYPKFTGRESECWPAAEAFAENVRNPTVPVGAPPSLPLALVETRRLL